MLKYLGLIAVFSASVMPAIEYTRRHRRRMREYELFIRLADGIHKEIATYMRPIPAFLTGFLGSELEDIGLKFSPECDFSRDFARSMGELSVSRAAKEALLAFFSALGTSSKDGEQRRAEELKAALVAEREHEREAAAKNGGAFRAVCCAIGLGAVILLI